MSDDLLLSPFRFRLEFSDGGGESAPVCRAAFSEISGLEASMEPKAIREGGWNRGERQRAGPVSYATLVLRRGVTPTAHLFRWFDLVASGAYAVRLDARLIHLGPGEDGERGRGVLVWHIARAMPVKFSAATLTATAANEVALEELHLVHEGLDLARGGGRP